MNINGHNPIHLFGGRYTAAAVDTEGSVFYITSGDMEAGRENIEKSVLPQSEKPVSIACCRSFVIASGSSGRVFCANVRYYREAGGKLTFGIVKELEGKEIIEVSGTYGHCLAVCKDGRVFVRGSDWRGRLGLGGRSSASEFTEISGLKHKIISASAGAAHSLFMTSEGKVLACGGNRCGELLTTEPGSDISTPAETTIRGGASFCIAGDCISFVFVGTEPPANTPNRRIKEKVTHKASPTLKKVTSGSRSIESRVKILEEENAALKAKVESQERELTILRDDKKNLEEELSQKCSELNKSVSANKRLREELEKLRKERDILKKSVNSRKDDILKESSKSSQEGKRDIAIIDVSTIDSLEKVRKIGRGVTSEVFEVLRKERLALKQLEIDIYEKEGKSSGIGASWSDR